MKDNDPLLSTDVSSKTDAILYSPIERRDAHDFAVSQTQLVGRLVEDGLDFGNGHGVLSQRTKRRKNRRD